MFDLLNAQVPENIKIKFKKSIEDYLKELNQFEKIPIKVTTKDGIIFKVESSV